MISSECVSAPGARIARDAAYSPHVVRASGETAGPDGVPAALLFGLVFVGYLAGSEVAFRLADAADLSAVLFVPAGITVAALIRNPVRRWPVVLVAAAVAEMIQDLRADLGVGASVGFAFANCLEPLVGALAVTSVVRRRLDLHVVRDLWVFLVGAVAGGPLVGAFTGAVVDRTIGGDAFFETFWQWWLGDAVGVLLIGSLILTWNADEPRRSTTSPLGLLLVVASVASAIVLLAVSDLPLLFLVLTGVVVAGALFGARTVAVTSVVVAASIAVWLVFEDGSLFAGQSPGTALVVVKLKVFVFGVAGLVVAAEVAERERATVATAELRTLAMAEHGVVERLQRLLLPPERMSGPHHDAVGLYLAARSELGVGGDWYEVAELVDGRVFVAVGDVVGGGAPAAAVMSRLRAVSRALAADAASAGALLRSLEHHLRGFGDALGTTVWLGVYEPADRSLTFTSAGHPPAFLLTGSAAERLAVAPNPPLGLDTVAAKNEARLRIPEGAALLLYTDGLIERRREPLDTGLERLEGVLRGVEVTVEPRAVVDAMHTDGPADDTVVLVVRLG